MTNIKVFQMSETMPVYVKNGLGLVLVSKDSLSGPSNLFISLPELKQESQEVPIDDGYELPAWVLENARLGYLGERIAKEYLEKTIGPVEWVSRISSRKGYDMEVGSQIFEIKTSKTNFSFEISLNELGISEKKAEQYNIFFIIINDGANNTFGYIFNDPLRKFKINLKKLREKINGEKVVFSPNSYRVDVEEYITDLEKIDLTKIYQTLASFGQPVKKIIP